MAMVEATIQSVKPNTSKSHTTSDASNDSLFHNTPSHHLASIEHIQHELERAERILARLVSTYPDDPDIRHALSDVSKDLSSKNFTHTAMIRATKLVAGRDKDIRENKDQEAKAVHEKSLEQQRPSRQHLVITPLAMDEYARSPSKAHPFSSQHFSNDAKHIQDNTPHTLRANASDHAIVSQSSPPSTQAASTSATSVDNTHTLAGAAAMAHRTSSPHQNMQTDHSNATRKARTSTPSSPHPSTIAHTSQHSTHDQNTSKTSKLASKAGKAATRTTLAVNAAAAVKAAMEGDTQAAKQYAENVAITTASEAATHKATRETVEHAAGRLGIKTFKAVSAKIPVWGGLVAGAFAVVDIGSETVAVASGTSNWKKLTSTVASGVVQVAGGLVGFGVGEIGQEAVHAGTKAAFGEQDAAGHSATVEVAILANDLLSSPAKLHENFRNKPRNASGDRNFEAALEKILPELEKTGLGNKLGNKDGTLTTSELKQTLKQFHINITDIDKPTQNGMGDGTITASEIIDALKKSGAVTMDAPTVSSTSPTSPTAPAKTPAKAHTNSPHTHKTSTH
jgi:hypothetical protein